MKANLVMTANCLFFLLWGTAGWSAVTIKNRPDANASEFVFIENNSDDNYFITPGKTLSPRLTGSNRWTSLKATSSGAGTQRSLGYIDDGENAIVNTGRVVDMWLENSSISTPLTGLRCINWYDGCDLATSLIKPQAIDNKGFYGVTVTAGGTKRLHGMLSDMFYHYLQKMPLGGSLKVQMNTCVTKEKYDAAKGERCINQASGDWEKTNLTHIKAAHMKLINTHALTEIFINSDGIPTIGEGNSDCKMQTIGKLSGISCKMVDYMLQHNGLSTTKISVFPAIMNEALASSISSYDMQFSLNGNDWKQVNGSRYDYNFNDLKTSKAIYVFFSSNFFKKMVTMGISDINTKDLFNFRFNNTLAPQSGWYEFSTSNSLIIKPRDFGISIISDEYTTAPTREGKVGNIEPSLDFGYLITTSGKTAADEVLIKVKGPTQVIDGQSYCVFSSSDKELQVPFPAKLTFTTQSATKQVYDAGCDNQWHDITHALWSSSPWNDASGDIGTMEKTRVMFSILMNNPRSLRTLDNQNWYGEVSASGEIYVQATWRNVK